MSAAARLSRLTILLFLLVPWESSAQSDGYSFVREGSRVATVPLVRVDTNTEITWPREAGGNWDTALLAVNVTAAPLPASPFVEVTAGDLSDRQHFAPGETGLRWINLSFLRGSLVGGSRVTLRGEAIQVAGETATLRLFSARPDLTRKMLVLAPHPDDAEIGSFGLWAGRNATVVTVTAGNAGPLSYGAVFADRADHFLFKGQLRVIDSVTVPWLGGIPPTQTFNLGYFDGRLADMHGRPTETIPEMYRPNTDIGVYRRYNLGSLMSKDARASSWTNLVDDLVAVLRKVDPAIVVAPHPQLDTHRDHQFTTVALTEALRRRRDKVTLLLYTNHVDRNRFPYGPAGTMVSLPPPTPATAATVLLDRVFSLPLSPEVQRMKLFAVEAMHDVRFSPMRQYQLAALPEARAAAPEPPGPLPDIGYLRLAPRSNELFFVYDQDTIVPMVDTFLTAWKNRVVVPPPSAP